MTFSQTLEELTAWVREYTGRDDIHVALNTEPLLAEPGGFSSAAYWEERYASGHGSGEGSSGEQALLKARFINDFVQDHDVRTVIELGSGDGQQLGLARYPAYIGLDVSQTAVDRCRMLFADDPSKEFHLMGSVQEFVGSSELALSLDVLYHLVEDSVYDHYLQSLFAVSGRWVILYTSDLDRGASNEGMAAHMRHRAVRADIDFDIEGWQLAYEVAALDGCWFVVYEKLVAP